MIFLAQIGGVYVNCMMGVMTRKNDQSYGILYTLLWEAFNAWGLDTNWSNHYFMMDFEVSMRTNLLFLFPEIIILGCYFHWSQVVIIEIQV